MSDAKPKMLLVGQTFAQSIIADTYSVAVLIGVMWFNANYCDGSGWIYFFTGFVWVLWILGRGTRKLMTPAQMRAWLDQRGEG